MKSNWPLPQGRDVRCRRASAQYCQAPRRGPVGDHDLCAPATDRRLRCAPADASPRTGSGCLQLHNRFRAPVSAPRRAGSIRTATRSRQVVPAPPIACVRTIRTALRHRLHADRRLHSARHGIVAWSSVDDYEFSLWSTPLDLTGIVHCSRIQLQHWLSRWARRRTSRGSPRAEQQSLWAPWSWPSGRPTSPEQWEIRRPFRSPNLRIPQRHSVRSERPDASEPRRLLQ
jgi:hypothetical protein